MQERSLVPPVWFPARQTGGVDRLTALLVDAQRGDRDSFESFIAETQSDVWRLCRYLGDAVDADDLAQETFERAISSLHRYRQEGPAKAWLLTIARRVCVDHTRRQQRIRRRAARAFNEVAAGDGRGTVIEQDASDGYALGDLVANLDEDRRAAFVLTQVLGLQYAEAAGVLGCPIGTVRSRVARARLDLIAANSAGEASGTFRGPQATDTG